MTADEEARRTAAAARIRAARGFAGMAQPELAEKLGVSLATIKRIEGGSRPLSIEELLNIGEACNVPADFMLHGFENLPTTLIDVKTFRITSPESDHIREGTPAECAARFADLEQRMDGFDATAAKIERAVRRLFRDPAEYDAE